MRRTLLTVTALAVLATGVGVATDQLMPDPGTAHRAATLEHLDTTERTPEPVAHGGLVSLPATPAPAAVTPRPTPVAP